MSDRIAIEEVDSVTPPPRARVEDARETFERKRDYLSGFLAQTPPDVAAGEPGGEVYEGIIAALKDIFDPEIPVN
ncbi:MAG TPA: SUF system Fe-S cluster assembly protein, partial [Sphingomonas sp.]|nr:SUF system Fe-S cluster assembly protein [Sphingomonas sp.]